MSKRPLEQKAEENAKPADPQLIGPPYCPGRLTCEQFFWQWTHRDDGTPVLHIYPGQVVSTPDGQNHPVVQGQPIALLFGADGWEAFRREVDRGGYTEIKPKIAVVPATELPKP